MTVLGGVLALLIWCLIGSVVALSYVQKIGIKYSLWNPWDICAVGTMILAWPLFFWRLWRWEEMRK